MLNFLFKGAHDLQITLRHVNTTSDNPVHFFNICWKSNPSVYA